MKKIFFALMILFIGCNAGEDKNLVTQHPIEEKIETINGEMLFKNNCSNCHKMDRDFVGPSLKGALKRWGNDKKAMYGFVRNPQKSITTNV